MGRSFPKRQPAPGTPDTSLIFFALPPSNEDQECELERDCDYSVKNVTAQLHGEWRFSLTLRFIAVKATGPAIHNGFNRFSSSSKETVKTVAAIQRSGCTAIHRGVNERDLKTQNASTIMAMP